MEQYGTSRLNNIYLPEKDKIIISIFGHFDCLNKASKFPDILNLIFKNLFHFCLKSIAISFKINSVQLRAVKNRLLTLCLFTLF